MKRIIRAAAGAAVAGLLFPALVTAQTTVIDVATQQTVGCWKRTDLADISHASTIRTGDSLEQTAQDSREEIARKTATGACFRIGRGKWAYMTPTSETSRDAWMGVATLRTKGGKTFYSPVWTWRFAGNVPEAPAGSGR